MKKIILMLIASIIFTSCDAPTKFDVVDPSTEKTMQGYAFTDFFNPVELVHASSSTTSKAIVMDKNTGVIYVWKVSGYQWGMSPIYDSDGSVLTFDKWLEKKE